MRLSRFLTVGFGLLVTAMLSLPAQAQVKISDTDDTKLYITLNTVGTFQSLHQSNAFDSKGVRLPNLTTGMQTAFGDLGFQGKFGQKQEVEMYFDLYLASRNHPSTTYGDEGYLIFHGVPENLAAAHRVLNPLFSRVDVKVGAFLLDYGDHLYHRSNNAISQSNPLVGNSVVDPNFVSVGGEIIGKPARFNWLLGVTNGTNTEDFSQGRGVAVNAKVWANPIQPLRTSVSFYSVDHSRSATSRATLFSGNRSGERYGGVLGGGQAPGGVLIGAGKDLAAGQFDITWDKAEIPLKLYANYGVVNDDNTNGPAPGKPRDKWNYYAAEMVYKFNPIVYASARYSAADADKLRSISSNGKVARIQIGGGLWISRNMLMKVEYVDQKYTGFAANDVINNGILAGRDPEFKGIVSEVSFAF